MSLARGLFSGSTDLCPNLCPNLAMERGGRVSELRISLLNDSGPDT
jgi:hypothetical protein